MSVATEQIVQLRRLVFRWKANATDPWSVYDVEPELLGDGDILTYSATPRMIERTSAVGSTSRPIPGTIDSLTASITVKADTFAIIGQILRNWTKSTYEGATETAGQMKIGDPTTGYCAGTQYVSVIAQGVCDDGSAADIEFARCYPQIDGDFALGTSSTPDVTFALNPQLYNAALNSTDGYEKYAVRIGDYSTTQKMRLNVTTGEYEVVGGSTGEGD